MAVDQQLITAIHRIELERDEAVRAVKVLLEQRTDLITELDEYKALEAALQAVKEARVRLKLAIRDNHALNRLEFEIGEAKFKRRDLGEILSHHLVAYHEDTGRDVVRDNESRTRQIELTAKLGKPALDQPRLPLGINRHFGNHVDIPAGKPEVKRIEVGEVTQ